MSFCCHASYSARSPSPFVGRFASRRMRIANRGRAAAGHRGASPRLDAGAHHSCGWTPPVPPKARAPVPSVIRLRRISSRAGNPLGLWCWTPRRLRLCLRSWLRHRPKQVSRACGSRAPGLRPPIWLPTRRRVSRGWDRERQSAPPACCRPCWGRVRSQGLRAARPGPTARQRRAVAPRKTDHPSRRRAKRCLPGAHRPLPAILPWGGYGRKGLRHSVGRPLLRAGCAPPAPCVLCPRGGVRHGR